MFFSYFIKLNSNVTFLNKVKLRQAFDQIPEYSVLTIDGSECNFIDYDILEIISEYSNKAHNRHIELHLKGIKKVNVIATHWQKRTTADKNVFSEFYLKISISIDSWNNY